MVTVCVRWCAVSVAIIYVAKLILENWCVLNQSLSWIGAMTSLFTWPVIVLIVLALFIKYGKMHVLLEAVVNFIDRSHYGNGDITINSTNLLNQVVCQRMKSPQDGCEAARRDEALRFESYALMRLQQARRCLIQRNVRIFKRGYSFDGGFSDGKTTFGVEVKFSTSVSAVEDVVDRVNTFYRQLEKDERRRFSFVLCLGVDDAVDRASITKPTRDSICPIDIVFLDRTMPDFYEVFGK